MRHCLYVPDKELQALIERYDRELSGKISYNEFLSELTAKSIYWKKLKCQLQIV